MRVEPGKSCATSSRLVLLNLYEKTDLTDALRSPLIHNFFRLEHPLARLAVQNLQQVEYLFAHRLLTPLNPLSNKLRAHAEHLGEVLQGSGREGSSWGNLDSAYFVSRLIAGNRNGQKLIISEPESVFLCSDVAAK